MAPPAIVFALSFVVAPPGVAQAAPVGGWPSAAPRPAPTVAPSDRAPAPPASLPTVAPSDRAPAPPAPRTRETARRDLEKELAPAARSAAELREILQRRWGGEGSREALDGAIARYLESTTEARRRHGRPLTARIDAAFEWNPTLGAFEAQAGPELDGLQRDRQEWLLALDTADDQLLRSLEGVTALDGAVPASRIRAALTGDRDRRPARDALAALVLDEFLAERPEPELRALSETPELDAWRTAWAAAARTRRRELDRLAVERAAALTERGPFGDGAEDPRRIAFERTIAAIEARELATEPPLAEINRAVLARLRMALAPTAVEAFDAAFARELHPEVLDSERSLRSLLESILVDPGLPSESRDFLVSLIAHQEARTQSPRKALLRAMAFRDAAERTERIDRSAAARQALLQREIAVLDARAAFRRALTQILRDARRVVPDSCRESAGSIDLRLDSLASEARMDAWRADAARAEAASNGLPRTAPPPPADPTTVAPSDEPGTTDERAP